MVLEQNRALIAAKNAEIRRAKNVLLTEAVQALEKKVKKGKGVNKQLIADRQAMVRTAPWLRLRAVQQQPAVRGGSSWQRAPRDGGTGGTLLLLLQGNGGGG